MVRWSDQEGAWYDEVEVKLYRAVVIKSSLHRAMDFFAHARFLRKWRQIWIFNRHTKVNKGILEHSLSPNVKFSHLLYQKDFKRDYHRTTVPCYQTIAPSSSRYRIISILPLRHCTIELPHQITAVPSLHLHFTIAPSSSQHCSIDPYLDGPMVRWCDGEIQGFKWILKMLNVKPLLYEIQMRKHLPIAGEAYLLATN